MRTSPRQLGLSILALIAIAACGDSIRRFKKIRIFFECFANFIKRPDVKLSFFAFCLTCWDGRKHRILIHSSEEREEANNERR